MNIIIKNIFFLLLVSQLLSVPIFGQSKYTFSEFGNETVDFIKQPANWDSNDWLKIGLFSASTFILMNTIDQPSRDFSQANQKYIKSVPIEFGRVWGEGYSPVILSAGFSLHSILANDISSSKVAFELAQATLYTGTVIYLLKTALGRSRPYTNEGIYSFAPFKTIFDSRNKSLPSGHSAVAFLVSTVLSRNVKSDFLKGLAYLPAALTVVSRVYQDHHWVSDTFLGATLGYFIAKWVVDQHESSKTDFEGTTLKGTTFYPISFSISL